MQCQIQIKTEQHGLSFTGGKGRREQGRRWEEEKIRAHITQLQGLLYSSGNQESMVLVENRHINQWNRIENPEVDIQMQSSLATKQNNSMDNHFDKWC